MPGGISYIGDLTIVESGGEITSQAIGDKSLLTTCADADTIEVSSSTGKLQIKAAGSSLANGVGRADVSKFAGTWLQGSLTASDSGGGVFSLTNTYGTTLVVTRVILLVGTASSGACAIDVGTTPTSATTSSNNLIDGVSVATAGVYDNIQDAGSSGESVQKWTSGSFLTASVSGGGATAGLVGTYAIQVIDIN
jgi:hypothetical protein